MAVNGSRVTQQRRRLRKPGDLTMVEVTARDIMSAVARYRRFAQQIVGQARCDEVLSDAALQAWQKRDQFDPAKGPLEAWLHPFVLWRAKDEQRRAIREADQEQAARMDAQVSVGSLTVADPLSALVKQLDCSNLVRYVSEFVSDDDWQIMLRLALTDATPTEIQAELGMSERTFRDHRAWVRQVSQTVRAAIRLAEKESPILISDILACVPAAGPTTYELLVRLVERPRPSYAEIAKEIGITESTVRNRAPGLLKLVDIASEVVLCERPDEEL